MQQPVLMDLQEDDMHLIYEELVQDYGAVTYEAFINLLVRTPIYLTSETDGRPRA